MANLQDEESSYSKRFRDDQTEKRIAEHLHNKNDLITEEDINNVKTNIGEAAEVIVLPDLPEEDEEQKEEAEEIADRE